LAQKQTPAELGDRLTALKGDTAVPILCTFYGAESDKVSRRFSDGRRQMTRAFNVIIERDSEGYYVASVPELPGCHTQARSLDTLMKRVREAIERCTVVPVHRGETTGPGLMSKILRDCGMTRDDLFGLL
jgi:predicted RNase H-like HicB family nuclease